MSKTLKDSKAEKKKRSPKPPPTKDEEGKGGHENLLLEALKELEGEEEMD